MADPISIISLVEGSVGLILQCGSTIKSLNDIARKYKHAELTLSSIIQEVDVIELAWKRIKDWFESHTNETTDVGLLLRLDMSLKFGTNVISALQDDLLEYEEDRLGIVPRARLAWNENTLRDHQYRIRGLVQAMSLLLQVMTLPKFIARSEQLQTVQDTFRKADESAYSIVPSQMSIRSSDRDSVFSVESAEFIQHRWSFEGDLLGARVYKRNYAKNLITSVLHSKMAQANDDAFTIIANNAVSATTVDELEASANSVLGSARDDATMIANNAVSATTVDELEASANSVLGSPRDDATMIANDAVSATAFDKLEAFANSVLGSSGDDATIIANDAVSATADDELETSANGVLGSARDDARRFNVEPSLVLVSEETSKDSESHGEYSSLDIVAIPGLIEEPLQTWTHPRTRHLWLRDSLAKDFISARIFTYNYPSYLLLSDDKAKITIYAEKLLSNLKTVGAGYNNRRLLFIAHSYGGFLCKQALVLARNDMRYSDIDRNTLLFCFFGTPEYFHVDNLPSSHPFDLGDLVDLYLKASSHPFDLGDLVDLYLKGLGGRTFSKRARSTLSETLKTNTGSLLEIEIAFEDTVYPLDVLNLYEKNVTRSVERKVSSTTKPLSSTS